MNMQYSWDGRAYIDIAVFEVLIPTADKASNRSIEPILSRDGLRNAKSLNIIVCAIQESHEKTPCG